MPVQHSAFFFFFFNDTATTEIYTLSLHDALPIWPTSIRARSRSIRGRPPKPLGRGHGRSFRCISTDGVRTCSRCRSEEHTSELQSQSNLVCRLLLEKKKKNQYTCAYDTSLTVTTQ